MGKVYNKTVICELEVYSDKRYSISIPLHDMNIDIRQHMLLVRPRV